MSRRLQTASPTPAILNIVVLVFVLFAFASLTACGRPEFGAPTSAGEDVVETDVDRETPSRGGDDFGGGEAPGEDPDSANNGSGGLDGNNAEAPDPTSGYQPQGDFAFAVYHALAAQGRNAVFAPHGLARSLVVAHAAVDATRAEQIANVLSPYLGLDIYEAFNATDLALEERQTATGFQMLGSVWAQDDVVVSADFVDVLARYLGLRVRLVDFAGAPEDARIAINNWHSGQTEGRLSEVLPPRTVDASTRFVVTDATWFSGDWAFGGFDPANTMYETFYGTENDVVLPMMRTETTLLAVEGPDFDAVIMPYTQGFSLLAIVPDDIDAFEATLDPDLLERLVGEAVPTDVALRFPRVEVSGRVTLSAVSDALGLADLFGATEYTAFEDDTVLHDAYQRTLISFDETGTDAVGDRDGAGTPLPEVSFVPFDFDRPFLFAIRDSQTSRLIFFGRVAQP